MATITLVVVPGPGARTVNIQNNSTTILDIVNQESLTNRDIILNGEAIPQNLWSSRTVSSSDEIFATASVKGNMAF